MKIGFIGFGSLGEQVYNMLTSYKKITASYFFDDVLYKNKKPNSFSFQNYSKKEFKNLHFYVCLGYKHLNKKREIIKYLIAEGCKVPTFVHHTSYVNPTAQIGMGTIIYPMCNIDKDTVVGNGVLLNNSVTLSHNNKIGDCCYLSPGIVTSGFVNIDEATFLGAGTVVSNKINIGKNVKTGIGTVVSKNIENNLSVIGNPMRKLNNSFKLI